VRKVELTERMAVGLAGALKLLKEGGWPPEKVVPFLREIHIQDDDLYVKMLERVIAGIHFWFYHHPGETYIVNVDMELVKPSSELGRNEWRTLTAQGHKQGEDLLFHCFFNDEGQAADVKGEFPYPYP